MNSPVSGELEIESVTSLLPLVYKEVSEGYAIVDDQRNTDANDANEIKDMKNKMIRLQRELNDLKLKEVERQQQEFAGTDKNKK